MTDTTANTPIPAQAKKPATLPEFLRAAKFDEVLPSFMKERVKDFVRLALVDIPRNQSLARIAQATPKKIVAALMDCARLGLMPGPLGLVYLVPFGDEVQVITGYKGLVELARRSGEVARVDAGVIYDEDAYDYVRGDEPRFEHRPNLKSTKRDEKDIVAAYAFAYDRDGRNLGGEVVPKAEVDAIRKRSKTGKSGPWATDYAEMAKKTAVRRASKLWPVSVDFLEATAVDDMHEDRLPATVGASSGAIENRPPIVSAALYEDDVAAMPSHTDEGEPIDPETGEIGTMTPPPRG